MCGGLRDIGIQFVDASYRTRPWFWAWNALRASGVTVSSSDGHVNPIPFIHPCSKTV